MLRAVPVENRQFADPIRLRRLEDVRDDLVPGVIFRRIFCEERVVAFDERALRTAQDRIDSRERADRLERSFQICKRNRIQKKIDAAEGDPRTVFTQKEDLFPERSAARSSGPFAIRS